MGACIGVATQVSNHGWLSPSITQSLESSAIELTTIVVIRFMKLCVARWDCYNLKRPCIYSLSDSFPVIFNNPSFVKLRTSSVFNRRVLSCYKTRLYPCSDRSSVQKIQEKSSIASFMLTCSLHAMQTAAYANGHRSALVSLSLQGDIVSLLVNLAFQADVRCASG